VNENDKIMTQYLTKRFVDHRSIRFAAKAVAKLPLHHAESGFDIRPLMIVLQKFGASELKVVVHLRPRSPARPVMARHKRDKRRGSHASNRIRVVPRSIALVGRDFRDLEIPRRGIDQRREQFGIAGKLPVNLNRRNYVGFDAAHDVALHPILFHFGSAIFDVKPAGKPRGCKTGRIGSKIRFNGFQGQTAFCNQVVQERSQRRILKVVGDAVEVRNFGDMPTSVRFSEIAHKTTLRNRGIDLEHDAKYRVRQGERRASILGRSDGEARTQIGEQRLESILFMGLSIVVSSPILWIGGALPCFSDGHALGNRRASVSVLFTFHNKGRSENMFALNAASLVVGASARRHFGRKVNLILFLAELRWDKPNALFPNNDSRCCQFHSTLFSQVHDALASLPNILLARYIYVKRYFEIFSLDSISVSGILPAWDWSRLNKRGTNAVVALTSGCLDTVPLTNRVFAPNANRRIGINLEKINEKRHNSFLKSLAEEWGIEPTVIAHRWGFLRPLAHLGITLPLNGRGIAVTHVEGEPCIRTHDSPSIPKRTPRSPFVRYPIAGSFIFCTKGSCYFGGQTGGELELNRRIIKSLGGIKYRYLPTVRKPK